MNIKGADRVTSPSPPSPHSYLQVQTEFPLATFSKLAVDPKLIETEEICMKGKCYSFNKQMDKIKVLFILFWVWHQMDKIKVQFCFGFDKQMDKIKVTIDYFRFPSAES